MAIFIYTRNLHITEGQILIKAKQNQGAEISLIPTMAPDEL
jgi:hypothetical protein